MKKEERIEKLKQKYGKEFERVYNEALRTYAGNERMAINSLAKVTRIGDVEGYGIGFSPRRNGTGGALILEGEDGKKKYINFRDETEIEQSGIQGIPDYSYVIYHNISVTDDIFKDKTYFNYTPTSKWETDATKEAYKIKAVPLGSVLESMQGTDESEFHFRVFTFYMQIDRVSVMDVNAESGKQRIIKLQLSDMFDGTRISAKAFLLEDGAVEPTKDFVANIATNWDAEKDMNRDARELSDALNLNLQYLEVIVQGWVGEYNGTPYLVLEEITSLEDMEGITPEKVEYENDTPILKVISVLMDSGNKGMTLSELMKNTNIPESDVKKIIEHLTINGSIYTDRDKIYMT